MHQALYHVRLLVDFLSWKQLMPNLEDRSAFHLFQQLHEISNKKAIQERPPSPTPDTSVWFPLSGIHWLVIGPVWHWLNLPAPLSKGSPSSSVSLT